MRGLALALALWPWAATAQDFPALYTVTGVEEDDVLNLRAEPAADSAIVASLPPDAANVEVIRLNPEGTWGWIGLPEGNGWAAMQFLIRQETDIGVIPRPLRCLGTEPFWAITLGTDGQERATPEGTEPLGMVSEAVAEGGYLAFLNDQDWLYSLTIAKAACSDGMSERDYGFAAHVFRQGAGGNELLTGCCLLGGE